MRRGNAGVEGRHVAEVSGARHPALEVPQDLHFFEGERYDLDGFVVMPNHVHVLVRPYAGTEAENEESRQECLQHTPPKLNPASLAGIMKNWKGFTSREINLRLGKRGTLWMDESFDHAVRSEAQLRKFRDYMRENPVTAHLEAGTFEHWQSADAGV